MAILSFRTRAIDAEGSISILHRLYKICNVKETTDFLSTFGGEVKSLINRAAKSLPYVLTSESRSHIDSRIQMSGWKSVPLPSQNFCLERNSDNQATQNYCITDKANRGQREPQARSESSPEASSYPRLDLSSAMHRQFVISGGQ